MELLHFCAPCLFGLEGILADELRRMGADNVTPQNGRVLFDGDAEIIRQAFAGNTIHDNRVFLKGVVSRKKQVVPALAILWG